MTTVARFRRPAYPPPGPKLTSQWEQCPMTSDGQARRTLPSAPRPPTRSVRGGDGRGPAARQTTAALQAFIEDLR